MFIKISAQKFQNKLAAKFGQLMRHIYDANKQALDPSEFHKEFTDIYPNFPRNRQHDAQEFFITLIQYLKPLNTDLFADLFDFSLFKLKSCQLCQHNSWINADNEFVSANFHGDSIKIRFLILGNPDFSGMKFETTMPSNAKCGDLISSIQTAFPPLKNGEFILYLVRAYEYLFPLDPNASLDLLDLFFNNEKNFIVA